MKNWPVVLVLMIVVGMLAAASSATAADCCPQKCCCTVTYQKPVVVTKMVECKKPFVECGPCGKLQVVWKTVKEPRKVVVTEPAQCVTCR